VCVIRPLLTADKSNAVWLPGIRPGLSLVPEHKRHSVARVTGKGWIQPWAGEEHGEVCQNGRDVTGERYAASEPRFGLLGTCEPCIQPEDWTAHDRARLTRLVASQRCPRDGYEINKHQALTRAGGGASRRGAVAVLANMDDSMWGLPEVKGLIPNLLSHRYRSVIKNRMKVGQTGQLIVSAANHYR
jgi:hypothetical protein